MQPAAPIILQADQRCLGGIFSSKNTSSWFFPLKKDKLNYYLGQCEFEANSIFKDQLKCYA